MQNNDQSMGVVEPNFTWSSKSQLTREVKSKDKESVDVGIRKISF